MNNETFLLVEQAENDWLPPAKHISNLPRLLVTPAIPLRQMQCVGWYEKKIIVMRRKFRLII